MATRNKSNELKLTRVFDAPVRAVWDAWTDPEQVARWWGPRGFSITTHKKDLRVGGSWVYTMHGPDGKDWPNTTQYHEVRECEALVYDHGASEGKPPLFRVSVYFKETGGKTTMDMTMTLATAEAAEETRKFIKKAGGESTWDRLAEYLERESSGKEKFVLNRSFDVPVERMFEMWTKPEHLAKWLPPAGIEVEFLRADIRPGGSSFSVMKGPGMQLYGRVEYLEIRQPTRIVYTQQFCDENERLARFPGAPLWPETMLATVDFTAEGAERTRVTITWEAFGDTTVEELAFFVQERRGMTQGWTGSLDKLEAVLAEGASVAKVS